MHDNITRRRFLTTSAGLALGCSICHAMIYPFTSFNTVSKRNSHVISILKKGEKQLFVDDTMIENFKGVIRKVHSAKKLDQPVLEANLPWEEGKEYNGKMDKRVYIYGTVLRDEKTGVFKMWYNRGQSVLFATSKDGIHWERPILNLLGKNNMTNLKFHSPSFILDKWESDPNRRYKAVGAIKDGISESQLQKLKEKFKTGDWYHERKLYFAAYSPDGLNWTMYPDPILIGCDTITFAQNPLTGEYLAFHKRQGDPTVKGRQVWLSVSNDMIKWSEPELVMATDEIDHQQARRLEGGTHSEFYNMSAFPYGNQWLGLVTLFQRTGIPKVKGPMQSSDDGSIDVQLVHSRNGRKWQRCSDRSPVIPLGPYPYDSGSILGVCNSPVIAGDEMWMYYTAITTTHGGYVPEKQLSIARAAWRLDGLVSMKATEVTGIVETIPFRTEGEKLFVNANVANGRLIVEVLDKNGIVIKGYEKDACIIPGKDSVKLPIKWSTSEILPMKRAIRLRFYLEHGDLYSYTIE